MRYVLRTFDGFIYTLKWDLASAGAGALSASKTALFAARAAVEAEEVAQAAKAAEGFYPLPRRAYRHQMFGERHNSMCCEGWCLLAAVSVQDTLPHRPQVFCVRDVASFDVGQL